MSFKCLSVKVPIDTTAGKLKSRVMARISGRKTFDLMTVKADEGQCFLLRMAPGAQIPAHEHVADEESLLLECEAMVGDIYLSAGDYHFARKGSLHGLVTTPTGCLLFLRSNRLNVFSVDYYPELD